MIELHYAVHLLLLKYHCVVCISSIERHLRVVSIRLNFNIRSTGSQKLPVYDIYVIVVFKIL